jgi:acyl carrier protein
MIPSTFVSLEELPLTPSGKIDRLALPGPEQTREGLERLVLPRTPSEEVVAEIWAELLKHQPVGIHDNFFALGGHSLLAAQVVARLRAAFGLEVPLRALFETPTVAGLAERIDTTTRLLDEVASLSADEVHLELSKETS